MDNDLSEPERWGNNDTGCIYSSTDGAHHNVALRGHLALNTVFTEMPLKKIKIAFSILFLYKRERRERIAFIDQHIPIMMFYLNNHKWAICSNLFLYSQHEIIPHPLKFFYESKMG